MRSKMYSNAYREYDREENTREWLKEKIQTLRPRPHSLINNNRNLLKNYPITGKMYLFMYEPQGKKKLPYYDMFPLAIPVELKRRLKKKSAKAQQAQMKIFECLNLHYCTTERREYILDKLFTTGNFLQNLYMLSSERGGKLILPMIRTYHINNVRSKFLEIPEEEYDLAIVHRTEKFIKKHKSVVWRNTERRIISG